MSIFVAIIDMFGKLIATITPFIFELRLFGVIILALVLHKVWAVMKVSLGGDATDSKSGGKK